MTLLNLLNMKKKTGANCCCDGVAPPKVYLTQSKDHENKSSTVIFPTEYSSSPKVDRQVKP